MLKRATSREPVGGHFAALPVPLDCTPWRTRHPSHLCAAGDRARLQDLLDLPLRDADRVTRTQTRLATCRNQQPS